MFDQLATFAAEGVVLDRVQLLLDALDPAVRCAGAPRVAMLRTVRGLYFGLCLAQVGEGSRVAANDLVLFPGREPGDPSSRGRRRWRGMRIHGRNGPRA